jgi:glycosyltransferase involved in cell wall biosynthesis
MTPISSITKQATRLPTDNLTVLTAPTHEAYETSLAKTGFEFWSAYHQTFKTWNTQYRPVPSNYHISKYLSVPLDIDVDVILSQNKFSQFQVLSEVSRQFNIPMISLEHTLPVPNWTSQELAARTYMRGHLNVFISEFSVSKWGFDISDPTVRVIHHGIDTELFKPSDKPRLNRILCVVNDWINRDWCCNFSGFIRTASKLPTKVVGATPNLSKPAASVEELVSEYQSSRVFYNTSTVSPVPTALMEAMACGCAVVSTATCMIPELIVHGVNGFMSNNEEELTGYLEQLLEDEELATKMGEAARQTIINKFGLEQFKKNWTNVIIEASKINACY